MEPTDFTQINPLEDDNDPANPAVLAARTSQYIVKIAEELTLKARNVEAVTALLEEGATVPFIARYRKEASGSMDEVAVTAIRDRLAQLRDLDKRRDAILKSITEQGKLTDELKEKIQAAETMTALEDLYLPYKPKRRTRATIAKEKGLEPLAQWIFEQQAGDLALEAAKYIHAEKEVNNPEEALAGARDIIAEWISEDQEARNQIRKLYWEKGEFFCKVLSDKEAEGIKYKDYFDWSEPVKSAPSHRILAMRRGAAEKILTLRILAPEELAHNLLEDMYLRTHGPVADQIRQAIVDGFKRLLSLQMETEIRLETKQTADREAIKVFAENVRQLLLSSPLGEKNVMALDPGFRTGCKLACLNRQGKLMHHEAIYPHNGQQKMIEAAETVLHLIKKFEIEAIAVGNGTAGRETEAFLGQLKLSIPVIMVNESGASIYSASEVAREEFPDLDLTVRGAVSIGRRLMDPLAELVKIDPKSIGVGQYQHDVDQNLLKDSLDDTVMSCVNNVGVEINTASKQLLTYVSGVGPTLAGKIVAHRNEHGPFQSRAEIKKVSGLGPKTFEQCAGFLRIRNARNPLDASAVHPESYGIVDRMAADLNCSVNDLIRDESLRGRIELGKYVTDTTGLPTLNDIKAELSKPGRDPRQQFEIFQFAEGINAMADLTVGMVLPGIITNITAFGAFCDIGVHQDGLIHISEMSDRFVKDPNEVVKVQQKVKVRVVEVDIERKRIALSMKSEQTSNKTAPQTHRQQDSPKPYRSAAAPSQNKRTSDNKRTDKANNRGNSAFGSGLNIPWGTK